MLDNDGDAVAGVNGDACLGAEDLAAAPPRKPLRRLWKCIDLEDGDAERKADGLKREEAGEAWTEGAVATRNSNATRSA